MMHSAYNDQRMNYDGPMPAYDKEPQTRPQLTRDIISSFESVLGDLETAASVLRDLEARLFGLQPEPVGGGHTNAKSANVADEISGRMAHAQSLAASIRYRAVDLSGRI